MIRLLRCRDGRCYSAKSDATGDFRIIDARPETTASQAPPSGDPNVQDPLMGTGMDADDEDMKEIAKFLPMLQASSKPGSLVVKAHALICLDSVQAE